MTRLLAALALAALLLAWLWRWSREVRPPAPWEPFAEPFGDL